MSMLSASRHDGRVTAVLGPTNTGKTHLAVERLLGHHTGVIGLPLRLLAREIYDRIRALHGAAHVALVTGEERIVPPHARWYVCTVESMPLDRDFDFLAVDEIQLCADAERGHIFTERLLTARGRLETMFLGADTVRGLVRRLVPEAEFVARPRFSELRYLGPKKLSRLPRRSAIVAFSAQDVYAIAELIRRQRGGAAVVMGALSPRTRNAQVAMYQQREVDFLVATDAIGMGLNMQVNHVAFAAIRKFDGQYPRNLIPAEVGQIAGRAGRHMNDGSFGTTADLGGLDADLIDQVENHRFAPVAQARWRNAQLRFDSTAQLLRSLEAPPPLDCLVRARDADDYLALAALARDAEVAALARGRERVRLLWQVCQIPDFRKTMAQTHAELLGQIYRHLARPAGVLPTDWVARQVDRLDRVDGDIDTLAGRIAHIRTWTYVSHRSAWLMDALAWQERARAIEDKLSDALHERLTQRFVDRRTALLMQRLKDRAELLAVVDDDGEVTVEGHFVGRLHGLRFAPDSTASGGEGRALRAAANRALAPEIARRAAALAAVADTGITLGDDGRLWWDGAPVARLLPGDEPLKPRLALLAAEHLATADRERVQRRLEAWLQQHLQHGLAALFRLQADALTGAARGLAYQLYEALGVLPRRGAMAQVAGLAAADRGRLRQFGVRIGQLDIYLPAVLKPGAARLCCLLWSIHAGLAPQLPPPPGRVSVPAAADLPAGYWQAAGYRVFAGLAVRVDMLERLATNARRLAAAGPFPPSPALLSLIACDAKHLAAILRALGYRADATAETPLYHRVGRDRAAVKRPRAPKRQPVVDPASPFARLQEIVKR